MAFITKEWKDRLTEFAGRRRLANVATGEETIVDVSRNEGTVSQEGDAFSAANMNDLEQRIANEFNTVNNNLTAEDATQFRFATDGEGNYGYLGADDSFIPFRSGVVLTDFYNYRNLEIAMENNFKTITFDLYMPANSNSTMLARYPQQFLIDGSNDGTSWNNIYVKRKTVVEATTYTGEIADIADYKYLKFHSGTNGSYLCSYENADIISNITWS